MCKLEEELNNFISTISKEEMKYNHKLREKVVLLQELMVKTLSSDKKKRPPEILKYLDPKGLLKA